MSMQISDVLGIETAPVRRRGDGGRPNLPATFAKSVVIIACGLSPALFALAAGGFGPALGALAVTGVVVAALAGPKP